VCNALAVCWMFLLSLGRSACDWSNEESGIDMWLMVTSTVSKHRGKDDSMSRGNELKADAVVPTC
jgi:hypothetical protein